MPHLQITDQPMSPWDQNKYTNNQSYLQKRTNKILTLCSQLSLSAKLKRTKRTMKQEKDQT